MAGALLALALWAVAVLACLVLAAWCLGRAAPAAAGTAGGAAGWPRRARPDPAASQHLVVDTLNLVHWLGGGAPLGPAAIVAAIDATAPALKLRHPGRVVYVLKDRESQFNLEEARALYQAAAARNGVHLAVAERYADPPASAAAASAAARAEHSSRGRDDFYMSVLADRYRCAVLTADRLRDFARFRATIPPFHVYEYSFWQARPAREFIRPDAAAYARLRRPRTVHPRALLAALQPAALQPAALQPAA